MKIPDTMAMSHLKYGDDFMLSTFSVLLANTLVKATMHHPSISVVTSVEREWTKYSEERNDCRTFAPMVPSMKPMILTIMTMIAVNSIFTPCLRHMRRDMTIVRIVRKSSSSMPASLQASATAACRTAKRCMIPDIFNGFMYCQS